MRLPADDPTACCCIPPAYLCCCQELLSFVSEHLLGICVHLLERVKCFVYRLCVPKELWNWTFWIKCFMLFVNVLAADCSCTTADCYVSVSFRLQFSDPLPSARCVEWVIAHTVIPEITHILTHVSTFHTVSGTRKFYGHLDLSAQSRSEPEGSIVSNCTEVHFFLFENSSFRL